MCRKLSRCAPAIHVIHPIMAELKIFDGDHNLKGRAMLMHTDPATLHHAKHNYYFGM